MGISIDDLHIDHPKYVAARLEAEEYLSLCSDGGGIIPILGPTRCGKTDLLKVLRDHMNTPGPRPRELPLEDFDDFVYAVIPPRPSDADIYRAILRSIGALVSPSEKLDTLRDRTIRLIRERGIRIIALDECSHCAEAGANFPKRAAADTFKFLRDQTGITFVLTGLPKFGELIEENEQLRERCMRTIELLPYQWTFEEDRSAFFGCVVRTIQHLEGEGLEVDLDPSELTKRLYGASGGRVGEMFELVRKTLVRFKSGDVLTLSAVANTARLVRHQSPGVPDFFELDRVTDIDLAQSYTRVMADAGLKAQVRKSIDMAAE